MSVSDYGIWLSYNNQEEGFRIPVNPPEIEMGIQGSGKTYEVSSLGEINMIKNPQLTEYSFESIFPASDQPFVVGELLIEPDYYVSRIRKWMASKRPIRFVFTGSSFDINEAVSIESFSWSEVAGSPGDIAYSLKLKKYVFFSARRVTLGGSAAAGSAAVVKTQPAARADDRQKPKTYKIIAGDTLIKVSKKTLGDDSRWREIQKHNSLTEAEIKKMPIGRILKIPG